MTKPCNLNPVTSARSRLAYKLTIIPPRGRASVYYIVYYIVTLYKPLLNILSSPQTDLIMAPAPKDRTIPPGIKDPARRTITNKLSGEIITFHKYGYETGGKSSEATLICKPGGGPPLHYHTTYAEKFIAVKQPVQVNLGGKNIVIQPGEAADVPIGTPHRFYNDTEVDVEFEGHVLPSHGGFEKSLAILFGLCNDDLADPMTKMPKSILHTAIIADMSDMRFPGFGGAIANYLMIGLATFARWRGVEEELLQKYWD